jgi:heme oxygenase
MVLSSAVSAPRDLLTQLRETTTAQHAALDHALTGGVPQLSPQRYAVLLGASLDVLSWLEPALEGWLADFAEARRVHRLRSDLEALGRTPAPADAARLRIASPSEAWGAAYVVEGSALGGLVLARAMREDARIEPRALSYVSLRGAGTGAHWRAFCGRLNAWGAGVSEHERATACRAAGDTFRAYRDAVVKRAEETATTSASARKGH